MVGDTWSPTASMRTLKYFLADTSKHKARVHQLDFIGVFLQAKIKNIFFVKLDMRYADYFPKDGEPVTPCMDVYKTKIQSDGSLDKLKLRIVVGGDLQNREMVGDTWSPTEPMRTLKYFLVDAAKH